MTKHRVVISRAALREIDDLPGNVRSRVRRAVVSLQEQHVLPQSKRLQYELPSGQELWRARLDEWRLLYLVDAEALEVYVLAVRRRPPYSYGDLSSLVEQVD